MHPTPAPVEDSDSDEDKDDSEDDDDDDFEGWESSENDVDNDNTKANLYELYLKGEVMPNSYHNEHQKFVAARQYMHKLQEAKNTQVRPVSSKLYNNNKRTF